MSSSGHAEVGVHDPRELVARLFELADYVVPFAVGVAANLRVADHLADRPLDVDELAARTGSNPSALYRVLRALAAKGVFAETSRRVFSLTPLADFLRSDHPHSVRELFLITDVMRSDLAAFAEIEFSVRTGESAFERAHGEEFWAYLSARPDEQRGFDALMAAITRVEFEAVAPAYDWAQFDMVVDVGGGNGAFLGALLGRHPHMKGVLFDAAAVVERVDPILDDPELATRCEVVAGDFREGVPPGGTCTCSSGSSTTTTTSPPARS